MEITVNIFEPSETEGEREVDEEALDVAGLVAEISTNLKVAGNALSRLAEKTEEIRGLIESQAFETEAGKDEQ